MRRWWNRLFVVLIVVVAGLSMGGEGARPTANINPPPAVNWFGETN